MKQYLFNINNLNTEDEERCVSLMTEERRSYILTVSNTRRRKASIAGEWLVKKAIYELYSVPIEEIIIERTQKGKPYVKDKNIHISISHSADFVAVAVATEPIGIDIEVIKPLDLKVADKACNQKDKQLLLSAKTEEEALLTFLKIWTAKEAYFKMKGTGITNLKEISYTDINAVHTFENNLIITTVK